ncbi:MAG: M1 family aminopeptidase/hydrolase, partial [Thermoanaerobaculia bacterium]|nr:M1 family aminopeptidase/hydrolase [Thermoanaerobaculia bacterium]
MTLISERRWVVALALVVAFVGCKVPGEDAAAPLPSVPPAETAPASPLIRAVEPGIDPHSYSNPDEVVVRHLSLDLDVDFDRKVLDGLAELRIENLGESDRIVLDTRDLDILGVKLDDGTETEWYLGEGDPHLGRPLVVRLEPGTTGISIRYETSPEAAAVQWLSPEQTLGKTDPFLFTQSQAILARTWIPIQDTPGVRMTYDATVRVPEGLLALMSAENPTEDDPSGLYEFEMPQAIPSYLLALAVGDLEFRALGPKSGVYAEPPMIERAAWELADTPEMIEAAEALYGEYRWGRYDVLILPPSFPFGGMENPRLTFATPTIIAGDRSLVSLIAHELAHSWSGNLVTNATWDDFWLNEGFTNYFTSRIMEAVYGREYAEMLALLSMQDLQEEIEELGPESPDTYLKLDLEGRDPDEGMTDIAYEKGYFFLRLLEETFGREVFDDFLRRYFDRFAFHSMTTEGFVQYLEEELIERYPAKDAVV